MIAGYATYEEARQHFRWSDRWRLLGVDPATFNLTEHCIDRPIRAGRGAATAARIVHSSGKYESYTFDELREASGRAATWLRALGLTKGTPVLVMVNPGLAWLSLHFAALRIGAPVVPASPVVGADSLQLRVAESGAQLVVASALEVDMAMLTSEVNCRVVDEVDVLRVIDDAAIPGYFGVAAGGGDPASFVFSSGTTGRPKRTVMSHRSYTFNALAVGGFVLGLTPADRYLKCGSTAWGGAFGWGVVTPMLNDTAAGIYAGSLDGEVLARAIRDLQLSVLWCPPSGVRRLLKVASSDLSLRKIGYAGEGASAALIAEAKAKFGAVMYGHYGATEVGLLTADYSFPDYDPRPGSLGRPLLGVDVAVLGETDTVVGNGEQGELAVRRDNRWHRTGDLGHQDSDGYLWLTGRVDDVIISGGYTIGPAEVEDCIRSHLAVNDVGVVGVPESDRGVIVKAFVELSEGETSSLALEQEIVDLVRRRVGKYAYPRSVEFVEELPRGDGGKVQRSRLRDQTGVAP